MHYSCSPDGRVSVVPQHSGTRNIAAGTLLAPADKKGSDFILFTESALFGLGGLAGGALPLLVVRYEARRSRAAGLTWGSGDSYTQTGFDIHGTQPNPANPIGNPAFPGSTFANGPNTRHPSANAPNYIGYLTAKYNKSFVETYDFGLGGATVDPAVVPSEFGRSVKSFQQQVDDVFLPSYVQQRPVPWNAANSLFTIFFGINDVIFSIGSGDPNVYYKVVQAYEKHVNQVSRVGAVVLALRS